jgi:hypothetical protein
MRSYGTEPKSEVYPCIEVLTLDFMSTYLPELPYLVSEL